MKTIKFLLALLVFCFDGAEAQIIAGDSISSGIHYQRIDSLLTLPWHANYGINCSVDVTGDGVVDFKFEYENQAGIMYYEEHNYVTILNHSLQIAVRNNNVLWPDTIPFNNLIDASLHWKDTNVVFVLRRTESSLAPKGVFTDGVKYIGFRKINNLDTTYGWIKVMPFGAIIINSMWAYGIRIEAYAIEESVVGIIKGDQEIEAFIKVYPNPALTGMHIHLEESEHGIQQPIIIDVIGKVVPIELMQVKSNIYYADVKNLSSGIYYISLLTDKGYVNQKFVVQK